MNGCHWWNYDVIVLSCLSYSLFSFTKVSTQTLERGVGQSLYSIGKRQHCTCSTSLDDSVETPSTCFTSVQGGKQPVSKMGCILSFFYLNFDFCGRFFHFWSRCLVTVNNCQWNCTSLSKPLSLSVQCPPHCQLQLQYQSILLAIQCTSYRRLISLFPPADAFGSDALSISLAIHRIKIEGWFSIWPVVEKKTAARSATQSHLSCCFPWIESNFFLIWFSVDARV